MVLLRSLTIQAAATTPPSGSGALQGSVDGTDNTAVALNALANNTNGDNNVALGRSAGAQRTTGSNNISIGFNLQALLARTTCYIKSIFGQTSPSGSAVFIDANHKLGTSTSSKRFKEDIKPMDLASQALFTQTGRLPLQKRD